MNIEKYKQMEPMRYWSFPSSMSRETARLNIEKIIESKDYLYSIKTDGNWSRAIICGESSILQTRGISKQTGTYGTIEDKVFFFEDMVKAFDKETVFLGEVYLPGGVDKNVGSMCRSLEHKAKSIQDNDYYLEISKTYKFSAKDRRDIENNAFRNVKLHYRIFDVLAYDGEDVSSFPIVERIKYIDKIVSRINNPLVDGVTYYEMNETFHENLSKIFAEGGEGIVAYKKSEPYLAGARKAWSTIKIKQQLRDDIDCFIIGIEKATFDYTGKELGTWEYWYDTMKNEKLLGSYFTEYRLGNSALLPITKNAFYNYPGAIRCGVYDYDGNIYELCRCAGLTDEFKEELRDNYKEYHMTPLKITGMAVSDSNGYSIRHPKIVSLRAQDIEIKDCTLRKVIEQSI